MQIQDLLAALQQPPLALPERNRLPPETVIRSLAYDSRKVEAGGLFIAVAGTHTDGRRFIGDAARRGAVAALGEPLTEGQESPLPYITVADVRQAHADISCAFYGYPARHLCTIGVTGTDGKTTTSNLTCDLLEAAGHPAGLMTTANFKLRGYEWENTTRQSTQEVQDIQQFLKETLESGATHAVIEATSHGLELRKVAGCEFDIGVVTNITHEHLDFHKTLAAYRRAKARLFEMLDPARDKGLGCRPVAILNRDDASYDVLKPYCRVPILDYGIDSPAAVRAIDLELRPHSTRFRVILPGAEGIIETPLVGRFNVSNCLAAIATVYSQGIALEDITHALATAKGVAGRMERIDEGQPFTVIVDYAHTPDSLQKVLAILRPLTQRKLIAVFGSAGERDVQKRPIMGRIAAEMTDFFVITDEDPREEDREQILREIAAGAIDNGKQPGRHFVCLADRRAAIETAFSYAGAGDTVLLAGKGHEQSIIIGREKIPWDDRRVAREILRQRP
ncbi:MAG: UDP-N-acetylmuramoyl-L-alanyl-D-glutamate--2,6-diaminopimelate ligase [Ktedonobacteraceae bacterium]|nr:UDP-N-acetylmuramoyl-L-alanyl-D-glutamate--2,6-diaminopimelate ligase [Ktedonobacteraceae bacterium]